MTVSAIEVVESRDTRINASDKSQQRVYLCKNVEDPDDIFDLIGTDIPSSISAPDGGIPTTWNLRAKTATPIDNTTYRATINYAPATRKNASIGDSSYSFSVGTNSVHITQSISTISKTVATGTAPDFKGAIGVQADGSVDGADIVEPTFSFSETHWKSDSDIDQAYKLAVFGVVGRVNDATFRGFAAGEVLCVGVDGRKTSDGSKWEITYSFSARKNQTSIAVGDITVPAKKGWELLWASYEKTVSNDRVVKQPVAAYIEQVYESADFDDLEITS